MANDIVFESERYEKRRSRNRWLIPALAVLGVLVLVIVIALIIQGGRPAIVSGGEDTPYPYVWKTEKNGSATLEIDCSAAPGYGWQPISSRQELTVVQDPQSAQGKTVFTVTPVSVGRALLSFALQGAEEADRIYELDFLVETAETKKTLRSTPVSVAGKPLQGLVRGGEGEDFPYTVFTDTDGDLCIAVTLPEFDLMESLTELHRQYEAGEITEEELDALDLSTLSPEYEWDCDASDESIALVLGAVYEEGESEAAAYFRPGETPGTVTLRMYDTVSGFCITAECENTGTGSLIVLDHSISYLSQ